jgi:hypothetical protein
MQKNSDKLAQTVTKQGLKPDILTGKGPFQPPHDIAAHGNLRIQQTPLRQHPTIESEQMPG